MIVELLIDLIVGLLFNLIPISVPSLPSAIYPYITSLFDYLEAGASILSNYVPFSYIMSLFGVILVVDAVILAYKLVMWIIRKIPVSVE